MLAILILPAGIVLGFGASAWLAYSDTRRGVHPPSMGGPKLQRPLLTKYRWLAVLGVVGWTAVGMVATPAIYWNLLGVVGAIVGSRVFNALDRRLTRHMG